MAESVTKQAASGNKVALGQTVSDVIANKVGGEVVKKLGLEVNTTPLARDADRTARVAVGDPTSSGRAQAVSTANNKLNTALGINQTANSVAGNTVQNASNATKANLNTSPIYRNLGVTPSDATNVRRPIVLIR